MNEPRIVIEISRSLQDVAPADITIEDEPLHYELIPSASQKGTDLLVDSTGYTYVVKAKATASDDVFKSARVIVVDSKKDVQGIVAVGRVNDAYVTRTVNRHRQQPEEPFDIDFEVSVTAMQNVTFNLDASYSLQSDRQDNGTNIAEQSIRVDRTFTEPEVLMERSLQDVAPADITIEDEPLHYELIPSASQKGTDLLVDSTGYTYVVKAKATASDDVFKSARVIVVDSKKDVQGIVAVGRVNDAYVTRTVNRHRQQPEEPIDMDFELIPGAMSSDFYRREVKVNGRRHLIFATDEQLTLLKETKRWYIDGTFKVMRKPFEMLLSIHGFVRRGEYSKQIPLLYAIMFGRKTSDYSTVFKAILRGLEGEQCVAEVVCDFEVALWKGVRHVFDGVSVHGCVFHWGQAVWRHVQSLGLATQYMQNEGTYCYIRKLLCLPFLPEEHIVPTFYALRDLNSCTQITPLLDYIDRTWLQSTTWEVENWCIFGQSVRTNNDCEGWHRKLNTRAGAAPPFYSLVTVLHHEAAEASTQVQLVSEMALRRMQRRAYRTMQSLIFQAWDRRPKPKWYVNLADFANMVKAFIGSNYLYVAFAFLQSGLGLGIIGIILIASLTDHCCHLLAKTKHHVIEQLCRQQASRRTSSVHDSSYSSCTNNHNAADGMYTHEYTDDESSPFIAGTGDHETSDFEIIDMQEHMFKHMTYGDMGRLCFGTTGVGIVNFCIALTQFGFCVAYFIFIGNTIHSLFPTKYCYMDPTTNTTICPELSTHVDATDQIPDVSLLHDITKETLTSLVLAGNVTTPIPMTTPNVTQPTNDTIPIYYIREIVSHAPNLILLVASPLPIFILFAFIRGVRYLGIISVVANVSILFGCVSILGFLISDFTVHESVVWFNWMNFPVFFGMVTAAFEGIGLVIPIESSMEDNRHLFSPFLHGAILFLTLILGSFGILGYLKFGEDTGQMLNANIPAGTPLSVAVNVGIMIGILLTFPLQVFPVIEILEKYLFAEGGACGPKRERETDADESEHLMARDMDPLLRDDQVAAHVPSSIPSWKRNILRILTVCFAAGLAILLRNMFAYVGAFVGAVGSSVLAFILPCLFHLKICWSDINVAIRAKDISILIFGVVASIVSVYSVIVRIASGTL